MIPALITSIIALILAALVISALRTPRGELPFPHEHGDGEIE